MLDDINVIKQRDPRGVFETFVESVKRLSVDPVIEDSEFDDRALGSIVFVAKDNDAIAAKCALAVLSSNLPMTVTHRLPNFAAANTLVVLLTDSKRDYELARQRNCQIAVVAVEGELIERAAEDQVVRIKIKQTGPTRYSILAKLEAVLALLRHFRIINSPEKSLTKYEHWLSNETERLHFTVPIHENYAKQLALLAVGKTSIFYSGGELSIAAKVWQTAWQETAKNIAWTSTYPNFAVSEMTGWLSHPIEKPYAIFDIDSQEKDIQNMMDISSKLLSGRRPSSTRVHIAGDTVLQKLAYAVILGEVTALYLAILNNVRPDESDMGKRFYSELSTILS